MKPTVAGHQKRHNEDGKCCSMHITTCVTAVAIAGFVLTVLQAIGLVVADEMAPIIPYMSESMAIITIPIFACILYVPLLSGAWKQNARLLVASLIINVLFIFWRLYIDYKRIRLAVFPCFLDIGRDNIPQGFCQRYAIILSVLVAVDLIRIVLDILFEIIVCCGYRYMKNEEEAVRLSPMVAMSSPGPPLSSANIVALSTVNTEPLSPSKISQPSSSKFSQPSRASTARSTKIVTLSPTNNSQTAGTQGGAGGGYYHKAVY